MINSIKKIDDGAYVVLNTLYTLKCVGYDSRVANQSLLVSGFVSADDDTEEETPATDAETA